MLRSSKYILPGKYFVYAFIAVMKIHNWYVSEASKTLLGVYQFEICDTYNI